MQQKSNHLEANTVSCATNVYCFAACHNVMTGMINCINNPEKGEVLYAYGLLRVFSVILVEMITS